MNFYEKCEFSQELTEFTKMQSEKFTNFAEFIKPKGQKFTRFLQAKNFAQFLQTAKAILKAKNSHNFVNLQTTKATLKAKNSRDFAILQTAKKFKHFTKTQTKGLRFDFI